MTGDEGGTLMDLEDDTFFIEKLQQQAYQYDGRELEVSDPTQLTEVIESLKLHFESKKNKKWVVEMVKTEEEEV